MKSTQNSCDLHNTLNISRTSKTHKIIAILLSCMLAVMIFPFSALAADNDSTQSKCEFDTAISGILFGRPASEYQTTTTFDYKWITSANPRLFNKDLAIFANMLATDIYQMAYVKGPSGKGTIGTKKTADDYTYFLKDLGFEQVQFIELADTEWEQDKDDVAGLLLAHRAIKVDNKTYDAFITVIRGTQGKGEWASDLDVGAQSDEYTKLTGDHPEWTNKSHHKGFDVCANRAQAVIDKFIQENSTDGNQKSMLITGHSRGAAEANILGTIYEKDENIRSFTYTFSCPLTTLLDPGQTNSYKTIFNYCEKNDLVGEVPMRKWNFNRYGSDIIGDSSKDKKYKDLIEEMMGQTFYDDDKKTLIDSLGGIVDTASNLYQDKKDKTKITAADAKASIDYLGISDCYWIGDEANSDGNYDRTYSDYFFLKSCSKLLEDMSKLTRASNSYELVDKIVSASRSVETSQVSTILQAQEPNQLTQALSEQTTSDINSAAEKTFTAASNQQQEQIDEAKIATATSSLDFLKDLIAIKQLIPNTNVEGAFNTFFDANKVAMLMPHLTATTFALTKIATSPTNAAATSFGTGEIVFVGLFVILIVAAIVFFVVFTRNKNSNRSKTSKNRK